MMNFHWLTPRSNKVLVPVTVLTMLALVFVEDGKRVVPSPWYDEMFQAAETSSTAARSLKRQRLDRGAFVDPVNDPAETALIGQEYTQITTDRGYLEAKLASTNPNFAAVVVDMLHQLQIKSGDCVAVAMTGSFPALNLSTLAALETLDTRPILISSVGSSNFGATDPYFTWLDMENAVAAEGILTTRSTAASLGGSNDTGRGLSPKGREFLRSAIERNAVPLIAAPHLEESILKRVRTYRESCSPQPIAAYINVGGGIASLGHSLNADLIPIGATAHLPQHNYPARGALLRLAAKGVPVIQLTNIQRLRDRYGLDSVEFEMPLPGSGEVFGQMRYHMPRVFLATFLILLILIGLYVWDQRLHRLGEMAPEDKTS
jgi:poly-gamma-glutamate system protein